jgi:adenylyltransferase/sulfurtransferase
VDVSNLQRQIVHSDLNVGQLKVESAAERLRGLNPDITIIPHAMRLTAHNAAAVVREYDLVVECSDNFAAKYLANDMCVLLGKPLVWGAVFQFDGQLSVVQPRHSACYRCIFAAPPPAGSVPTCVQAGILGALVGVIGCWQALEAVKVLTGAGQPLANRLLIFDGLAAEPQIVQIQRRPDCVLCGDTPTLTDVAAVDYDAFYGGGRPA